MICSKSKDFCVAVSLCNKSSLEFLVLQGGNYELKIVIVIEKWSPPPYGCLKVNVDVGFIN